MDVQRDRWGSLANNYRDDNRLKVAIVILNWNGSDMLRKFLPSVLSYSQREGVKVYVADNASTDNSLEVLVSEFTSVGCLPLDRNYGFANGYNIALKQVNAEYYVLLNSDVEVTENWLEPLLTYMESFPDVAACQPKILSWRKRDSFEYAGACGGYIDYLGYPFCRGRVMDTVEPDKGQYETVARVFWTSGAALMIRSEDYWKVGGLDGRFFAHMEEIDLCWRLANQGKQLVCIPQSVVYHIGGATLKSNNPRKTFLNFRNSLIMLYKNLSETDLANVMHKRMFLDYLAAFFFLLKLQIPHAKAVIEARAAFNEMKYEFSMERNLLASRKSFDNLTGVFRNSLLKEYYFRRKKSFSQLRNKITGIDKK